MQRRSKLGYHPRPKVCEGCPANPTSKSFVLPTGPKDAKIVLVGQGPGQDEALDGQPFVGPSGKKLDSWLVRAGIRRHECAVGNVVWCWLPKNRPPTAAEVAHCRGAHWGPWLEQFSSARVIVPIGVPAATALLGKERGKSSSAGVVFASEPIPYTIPISHPAYIIRGNWPEEPAQIEYLKRAKDIADGNTPITTFTIATERTIFTPQLTSLTQWESRLSGEPVAMDLETAGDHIRLVGLYDRSAGYLAFPIRVQGGGQYWGTDELPFAVEWLWGFLDNPDIPKCCHNGQAFDVPMLERNGFSVRGYCFDTMLGMHITSPGMPKDLESLAKLFLGIGGWKEMVKGEGVGEGK